MLARKAFVLAVALGGEVDTHSPAREARVRLTLPWGHVLQLDETHGETFRC